METTDKQLVQAVLTVRERHPEWPLDLIGDAAAATLESDEASDIVIAVERHAAALHAESSSRIR